MCYRSGERYYKARRINNEPARPAKNRRFGLPARLSVDLRARGRDPRRAHHRPGPRRRGECLHGGRDLRQGRALRRARASPRSPEASAAPRRRQGLRRICADLVGRRARSRRRAVPARRTTARLRSGVAVLLRRHHGPRAARRHQSAAPRQEIFRLLLHHLRQSGVDRFHRRHRQARRRRSARNGEVRPGDDLGHQCGEHPGQCDDARDARPQGTRRQDRRRRHLHELDHAAGRPGGADPARHRRRAGLRGDALPVPRRQGRLGLSRALHRRAARA